MKILITVSFDGTNYNGYQLQGEKPTVALMLNRAAEKTFGFPCNVTGCSRTDSGVHALGFAATIEPRSKKDAISVPIDKIALAMNANLPDDISVLSACPVDDTFHPRYGVVKKEYVYKIHDSEIRNPSAQTVNSMMSPSRFMQLPKTVLSVSVILEPLDINESK